MIPRIICMISLLNDVNIVCVYIASIVTSIAAVCAAVQRIIHTLIEIRVYIHKYEE